MIRFVTLFPDCPNFGLSKDVGQIPYMLQKLYPDFQAKLVSFAIDPQGEYLEQAPGLDIEACPNIRGNALLSGLAYILRNAKKIDWLNIYHARIQTLLWMYVYKFLNPKGKVYLKLDAGFVSCDTYDGDKKKRNIFTRATQVADLVTVESQAAKDRLTPYSKKELILIPNGYCETDTLPDVTAPRQNTFITVSRLGTPEKATGLLLEAFAKTASAHNWNLLLVGPVAPEFEKEKTAFLATHPRLSNRIKFVGPITDRDLLNRYYCNAKVFLLPSLWEACPLVVPEALSCGCKVLVSDQVTPHRDFTDDGKYGQSVPSGNTDAWAQALLDATKEDYTPVLSQTIAGYADQKYTWKNICPQLRKYIV